MNSENLVQQFRRRQCTTATTCWAPPWLELSMSSSLADQSRSTLGGTGFAPIQPSSRLSVNYKICSLQRKASRSNNSFKPTPLRGAA